MMQSFDLNHFIVDVLGTNRIATEAELDDIRHVVAAAGFDPSAITRVGSRASGQQWQGQMLTGSERLSVEAAHYLRHVIAAQEWPPLTTVDDYVASLRSTIENTHGPLLLDLLPGWPRLTFFAPSGVSRGPHGRDWILVAFDVNYGYWTTGYQPVFDPEMHRQQVLGGASQWLYRPDI